MKTPITALVTVVAVALLAGCVASSPKTTPAVAAAGAEAGSPDVVMAGTAADRLAANAMRLLETGKLDEASAQIKEALRLQTDRSYFHLVNGLIYHLQGRDGKEAAYELAEQGYELALQFDQTNWQAGYFAGLLAIDQGDFNKAATQFAGALQYRNDDVNLLQALAYAAYRAGQPQVAAGAINALVDLDALGGPTDLRNAAMIMAAVGEHDRADGFLKALRERHPDEEVASEVKRRLADWRNTYQRAEAGAALQPVSQGMATTTPVNAWAPMPNTGSAALPGAPMPNTGSVAQPGAPADRMVVVDVVIISTEEDLSSVNGVNLLNGLQVQFGMNAQGFPEAAYYKGSFTSGANPTSQTIARSLGVPSIKYSMNIFNTASQRSEILARPTLVARSGRRSEFFSGIELNAVAVSTGVAGGQPVQINKEIGVSLGITPTFLDDGRISVDVDARRTFLRTPSKDVAFEFKVETTKSNVNASVVMRYGESLILGGLSEKETGDTRDGVPLLQDIPVVQYLFSRRGTRNFQKSVLILLTPRPAEYVYQPEAARVANEQAMTSDERALAGLRARYSDWFRPYPNSASMFRQMQNNSLYREFRTGDVGLESWTDMRKLSERLKSVSKLLHY